MGRDDMLDRAHDDFLLAGDIFFGLLMALAFRVAEGVGKLESWVRKAASRGRSGSGEGSESIGRGGKAGRGGRSRLSGAEEEEEAEACDGTPQGANEAQANGGGKIARKKVTASGPHGGTSSDDAGARRQRNDVELQNAIRSRLQSRMKLGMAEDEGTDEDEEDNEDTMAARRPSGQKTNATPKPTRSTPSARVVTEIELADEDQGHGKAKPKGTKGPVTHAVAAAAAVVGMKKNAVKEEKQKLTQGSWDLE